MSNSFLFKDKQQFCVGMTITVSYKIKEDKKERIQDFQGIFITVKGMGENKMFTVRKFTKSGIGVERIFPVASPHIAQIKVNKKSSYQKAKAYFIKDLSQQKLKEKLYH